MKTFLIGCLTAFMLGGALNGRALAQFGTPVIDGSIAPAEYGTHVNGENQETSGGQVWYMTWDATNLYVGLTGANTAEGAILYLDAGPLAPINGGTNADGTITGFSYDNTNFSDLQFRADLVVYVKDGYREYRTADGANGWSGPTAGFGAYASAAGADREVSIPWSAMGGIPSAFTWFGYVTSGGGIVYGQLPAENTSGLIGLSAREERYYAITSTTDGASTKPFSRNCYVFNRSSDAVGFGAISVYDLTMNSAGRTITRAAGGGAAWTVAGTLRIADGTVDFGTSTTPAAIGGDLAIGAGGTLALSSAPGGDLSLAGNWTLVTGGTFTPANRAVFFNGTGTQNLTGATTFDYLLVDKSSGTLTLADDATVNQGLTLTNGVASTGVKKVSLGSAAFAARTNGHVHGNLEKAFTAGLHAFGFPIGDASTFAPLQLDNFTVTAPGSVTARTTGGGDHPNIGSSEIDAARSVNRYWTLSKDAGLAFTSYDPTVTFVPGDLDGGANTADFRIARFDIGVWNSTTTGIRTATSTGATGVTSFSDFIVGEPVDYTITASAGLGGTITPSGAVLVASGSDTTFIIAPATGYHIDSVVVDGVNQGVIASFPFTAVDSNHTINAYFSIDTFTITASVIGNGTINPSGAVIVRHGSDTTFVITPAANHHIDSVVVDGLNQGVVQTFPFAAVDSNHTIAAYISIDTYTITASASSGGSINPSGGVIVPHGSDTTFTITPDPGYHVDSVVVDDVNLGAVRSFAFTAVDSNHTITAYFSINVYTITASVIGNGTINPSGAVAVTYGSDTTFVVNPAANHHIDSVVVDGVNQGVVPSFTFTAVDSNHTISAYFSINTYTITASVTGNGTITPSGAVTVTHGSDTTFVITPAANHHIDSVVVDGLNQGVVQSFPFAAVNSNHTIAAYFSIDTHTITASASSGGSITPSGGVIVPHGSDTTFVITPDPGYQVDSVVVDGTNIGTPLTYPFPAVVVNHSITAYFSVNSYIIVATAVGGGTITPSGTVVLAYGSNQNFTMTPDSGYHGDSVVVDGVNQGVVALYSFTAVDTNHAITAYFSIDRYPIIAAVVGAGTITPPDTVLVPFGANQTFTITPDTGYHIDSVLVDGVSLGVTASYTFVAVDTAHTITAYFSINYYTITASAVGPGTIAPAGPVVLAYGTNQTFIVTPDTGYHVDSLVVDGINRGPFATYTFTAVKSNHTITAYLSLNVYAITATATSGGTISPGGVVNAGHGATITFTITPTLGRHIDSVVVDGVNQGVILSYTFPNITANHTIRAWFSIDLFTITATADTQGTISPSGVVVVPYGSSRTFIITARRGYGVLDVLVDSVSVGPVKTYTFTNVTTNHTIAVSFKQVNVFLTLTVDSIVAKDPATSKYWKPARRYRGFRPTWANLMTEVVYQGGFQPGATESDMAGGMRVGVSYMVAATPVKWKPVKDSAKTMAWVRLTKWDAKKNLGKAYTALLKTLEDKTGRHDELPTGFDHHGLPSPEGVPLTGQLLLLPPKKHNNSLFGELVALKLNIAASQLGKTPVGFGELLYVNDGHLCDGMSIVEISAKTDTVLTRWQGVDDSVYQELYDAIYDINRAFPSPIDTVYFNAGGQLVLDGEVDVADVPFLRRDTTVAARRLVRTTDATEGEEDFEDPEFEEGIPVAAKLYQNYPNPFNPSTTINFRLWEPSLVTIAVYNVLGQEVATLARDEEMEEGYQTVEFLPNGLATGVYFCRIDAQGLDDAGLRTVVTNKMLLLK